MIEVVMIMVCCTLFNHMGLCEAIEQKTRHKFMIINCSKCATYWFCLFYMIFTTCNVLLSLFIAFIMAYSALWFEMLLGYMTTIYNKIYDEIYTSKENKATRVKKNS